MYRSPSALRASWVKSGLQTSVYQNLRCARHMSSQDKIYIYICAQLAWSSPLSHVVKSDMHDSNVVLCAMHVMAKSFIVLLFVFHCLSLERLTVVTKYFTGHIVC